MDSQTKSEYEAKCAKLRLDLKKWESDWAKAHGGKKPDRDDIKSNAEIGMHSRSSCLNIILTSPPLHSPKIQALSKMSRYLRWQSASTTTQRRNQVEET